MKEYFFKSFKMDIIIGSIPKEIFISKLIEYSNRIIKYHNSQLIIKKHELNTHPINLQWYYITIITTPNINHPYIIYADITSDILNMLIPYGTDEQIHSPLQKIPDIIPLCMPIEKYALYLSITKSIELRKSAILESDQYNLLKCENITNCAKKFNEIRKMNISNKQKTIMITECKIYYYKKAIEFLKRYFNLLTIQNYVEAKEFLKGNTGKYYGKQRLNTFFKNSKSIIGHLQIFIPLYQYGAILSSKV